jgi:hypothetical protein
MHFLAGLLTILRDSGRSGLVLVLRPKRLIPGEGRKRLEKTQHQQRLN